MSLPCRGLDNVTSLSSDSPQIIKGVMVSSVPQPGLYSVCLVPQLGQANRDSDDDSEASEESLGLLTEEMPR